MELISNINKCKSKLNKIAVIGAGISGLSFVHSVSADDNISIDLFERSRVLAGRASTKKADGLVMDNGANYLSTTNERVLNTILNELKTDELITIDKWIYPFSKNNIINFDKIQAEAHNRMVKYNYRSGINKLGTLLYNNFKLKNFNCLFSQNVDKITGVNEENQLKWEIYVKEKKYGPYDCIIFSAPAANVARVLKNSTENNKEFDISIIRGLEQVSYKKIYSLAISYEGSFKFDFYALINSDREHPISWISVENDKEGHVSNHSNQTVLIVQMSEDFSEKYSDTETYPNDAVLEKITFEINNLLPQLKDSKILYSNLKLWRLALPKNSIDSDTNQKLREKNIFAIGDSILGKGRLDGAMLSGFELYDQLKPSF